MIETITGFDTSLFILINHLHHPVADRFFQVVTFLGSGWVVIPLLLALVLWKIPRVHLVRTIVCCAIGMSLCGIVNSQIKRKVNRPRPVAFFVQHGPGSDRAADNSRNEHRVWNVRLLGPDYGSRSFPSGHTNTAFAAATFLGLLLGGWWYLAFAGALIVGYSRVYLGVHFPLDTVAGALLGTLLMWIVFLACRCGRKRMLTKGIYGKQ